MTDAFTADEGYRSVDRAALALTREEHPALIKVAYSHDSECSPALRHVARTALGLAACEPRQDCKTCEKPSPGPVDCERQERPRTDGSAGGSTRRD